MMSEEMPKDIYVEYRGRVSKDLDMKIALAMKPLDYTCTGSGYQVEKNLRDLHFVRNDVL